MFQEVLARTGKFVFFFLGFQREAFLLGKKLFIGPNREEFFYWADIRSLFIGPLLKDLYWSIARKVVFKEIRIN